MSSIVARIERIRSGHSDRALVHAIDTRGHDYKIEVPIADVSELLAGHGHLLVLSWSIHANPIAAMTTVGASAPEPAPQHTAPPIAVAPSSVDAQFIALMNRRAGAEPTLDKSKSVPADAPSPSSITPEQQLASMFGMPRDSKPTT